MPDEARTPPERQEFLREDKTVSRRRTLDIPVGPLLLQDFCPPSLVESLRADTGLHAFAHLPEREHQLLVGIARQPDSALALAYTSSGDIVGEVTLAPAGPWWRDEEPIYEVAIEVSSRWRRRGIAQKLLAFALELDVLERVIVLGMGLSWHWDMQGLGLSAFRYRKLIASLFASHGFAEYLTAEPNISMDPANILLVRIGSHVDQETMNQFFYRLLQSDTLPGLQ